MTVIAPERERSRSWYRKLVPPTQSPFKAGGVESDEEPRYRKIDFGLIRRMARTLMPYWRIYLVGTILGLVHVVLEMLGPKFMQHLIQFTATAAKDVSRFGPIIRATANWHVVLVVWCWALVLLMSVVLQRYTILAMTAAGEQVQFSLRRAIFGHLQKLSMSYYDKTKLGRIISRCTSDIDSMREVNVWGLFKILADVLQIVVAAFMIFTTDWRLFLSICWLGPVLYVANRKYLVKSSAMWQTVREGFTKVSTNLAENITGTRVVVAYHRQDPNLDEFNRLQVDNTGNNVDAARINGLYLPALDFIRFLGRLIILCFGAYLIVSGNVARGVGAVVAVYLYWDWFMNPIIDLGSFYNQLMIAVAGAERVYNLLDTQPDVQDEAGALDLPRIVGHVRFDHVTFGYKPETPVLHDISFEALPGQMIALVGATGSGKSSIVSLITRFYQPQQGRVLVDGHDLRQVRGESLHRQTGLVLQVNYLFTGTVMENIRYAKPDATEEQVIAAATGIGSHDAIMTLAEGYQTEVGERGANMSLGQRQLICFTRAYLANPRLFMLDEATSAVDTATELEVQQSLEKLRAGRTTFVVAHRLSTILSADQILVIDAGQIVERGTHRELVAAGGKYAHMYEQFAQQRD